MSGRPPERWIFICDIRADGTVPPAVVARRLLKHLLRRWGIKCRWYSEDRRLFELAAEKRKTPQDHRWPGRPSAPR